jgi:hypothetical protein
MRPFAAGSALEMLGFLLSIPYGTNSKAIFPKIFLQNFTVAPHPWEGFLRHRT